MPGKFCFVKAIMLIAVFAFSFSCSSAIPKSVSDLNIRFSKASFKGFWES